MDYTNIFPFEDCPFKMKALSYDSQEDWEELRTKGVGGSDAGAILGLNKYTTPFRITHPASTQLYHVLSIFPQILQSP